MKKIVIILFISLISLSIYAQNISGKWNGILKVQGTQLRLVFNIVKTDNGYSSTMDSPDQGAKGIPVTQTIFSNSILKLEVSNAGIKYEGTLNKDGVFNGTFKQGGLSLPLSIEEESIWGVTAELNIKYKKPVPLDQELKVVARITRNTSRIFEGEGKILLENGDIAVTATGKYIKMSLNKIVDVDVNDEDVACNTIVTGNNISEIEY